MIESRGHGGGLPVIFSEPDYLNAGILFVNLSQNFEAVIRASIIHIDNLTFYVQAIQNRSEFFVESSEIFLFVENGNNHRNFPNATTGITQCFHSK